MSSQEKQQTTGARASRARIEGVKRRFERQNWIAAAVVFAVAFFLPMAPFVEGWMVGQAALVIVYIMAAQGVAILTGYTGLVTVGHGGFLAIGAYTAALLMKYFGTGLVVGMIAGGLVASVFGCLLGLLFLRLAGAFMAIGTLGFAFFIGTIVNNVPIFEGREGISLPRNHVLGLEIGDFGFYYVALIALAVITIFIWSLVRSGVGRAFKALRDSERAAESSGVNRLAFRTLAFSVSAFITGVAGALNGLIVNYVSAEVYADIWYSVDLLLAVVVGGSAMLMGPFVGGAFVVMIPFFFEELADFAFILKGVVLIMVLMFAPAGVVSLVARPVRALRRRKLVAAGDRLGQDDVSARSSAESSAASTGGDR